MDARALLSLLLPSVAVGVSDDGVKCIGPTGCGMAALGGSRSKGIGKDKGIEVSLGHTPTHTRIASFYQHP